MTGLLQSRDHMDWRLFRLFSLTLNAGPDEVFWVTLGRIVDWLRNAETRFVQELLQDLQDAPTTQPVEYVDCESKSIERGRALKFYRKKLGWSQRQMFNESLDRGIGGASGVYRSMIRRAEKGETITRETFLKIIGLLEVSDTDVLRKMREMGPN